LDLNAALAIAQVTASIGDETLTRIESYPETAWVSGLRGHKHEMAASQKEAAISILTPNIAKSVVDAYTASVAEI